MKILTKNKDSINIQIELLNAPNDKYSNNRKNNKKGPHDEQE